MTLFPTSIRAKLTLTAVTVMGVLFVVLGAVVQIAGREQIMSGVDTEIAKRADEIIQVHKELQKDRPPPPPDGQGGPPPGGEQGPPDQGQGPRQGPDRRPENGGPGRGPGPDRRIGRFQAALQRIGDPLLSIGPRFVAITEGPPFAPPDMMVPYDKVAASEAERHGTTYSTIKLGNEKVRIITKLATDDNGRKWMVQFPYPLGDIDKSLTKLSQTLLLLLPIGLVLTAIACLFLMKRVMKPIRDITTTADSIGAEDLSGRLTVAGKDEFALLGGTMNGMLGRLEKAFAIQRQTLQRLEAILKQQRRFTADASHELKTPLAVIKANTGLMLHGMPLSEDARNSVNAIDSAATRMNRLVQGLMLLAKAESGQPSNTTEKLDLNLVLQNAVDHVFCPKGKAVTFESESEETSVMGCEGDLERVFVNLIDNACRHTSASGHIVVRSKYVDAEVVVTVEDDGEGIGTEHLEHIFDRFYRVDSARSSDTGGTGLGLAICKGIVEAHGGNISIASELGKGTTVTVRIPAVR